MSPRVQRSSEENAGAPQTAAAWTAPGPPHGPTRTTHPLLPRLRSRPRLHGGPTAALHDASAAGLWPRDTCTRETIMDDTLDTQPSKQEMQARLREMLAHIRRSIAATPETPKLAARTPRQTLPLAKAARQARP